MHRYSSNIFSSISLGENEREILEKIREHIEKKDEDYILNVNQEEFIKYLENQFKLESPTILFDEVYLDSHEDFIPAENFPSFVRFNIERGKKYKKQVIQYIIPVEGNTKLLSYKPSSLLGVSCNFTIRKDSIFINIIDFYKEPEEIKKQYESEVKYLKQIYERLIDEIDSFNKTLKFKIESYFEMRKEKLLVNNNLLASLGVPLKKEKRVSKTFSIPKPKLREKILIQPKVYEKGFKPEPSLDNDTYQSILSIINDVGKNFECMPSTYKDKEEEHLRDHILMNLDPHFKLGSASGETFNSTGKTDILLRYDSSVVFVAECKFWKGEKSYLKTLTQLLGYLTWRDTKTSVVIFVSQKDISSILDKVENHTKEHSNYLGFINKSDENWFNYRFHINGDKNREVKVAVQLFHLPK